MHLDENTPRAIVDAYDRFARAEEAWSAEIRKVFGRVDERMARFLPKGRGQPGTELRAAYDARQAALAEFEAITLK